MRRRIAVLVLALAVPAVAAPGARFARFADLPGDARAHGARPAEDAREPMAFERPGMSFPGSAFYHLADPPAQAALIALPGADPLGGEAGAPGHRLDPGPAAAPFHAAAASARAEHCLAEAVFYEAAGESEAGQRAVAQVVLNRVRHPAWPDSVCGVVFEGAERATGCQFTFTCDASRARRPAGAGWARARRIARAALSGAVQPQVGLATHYHALWVAPGWADRLDPVGTIGAHRFYRARGAAGRPAAFDAPYAGAEPAAPGAGGGAGGGAARGDAPGLARASVQARAPAAPPEPPASPPAAPSPTPPAAPSPAANAAPPASASLAPSASAGPSGPAQGSGSVRARYRSAGRWKARPGKADPEPPRIAVEPVAGPQERIGPRR